MQETWVQSLGWEDPLKKGKATHSSILAWPGEFHGLYNPWGHKELDTTEWFSLHLTSQYGKILNSLISFGNFLLKCQVKKERKGKKKKKWVQWLEQQVLMRINLEELCPSWTLSVHRWKCYSFSHIQLFAIPWTVAHQAPLSMAFSLQEYWSR